MFPGILVHLPGPSRAISTASMTGYHICTYNSLSRCLEVRFDKFTFGKLTPLIPRNLVPSDSISKYYQFTTESEPGGWRDLQGTIIVTFGLSTKSIHMVQSVNVSRGSAPFYRGQYLVFHWQREEMHIL